MAKLIDITGKALSGEWGADDKTGNGIPVLRTTNFTNEGIINYNDVVTRVITKKNIDDKFLRNGDIIIEKSGGSDKFPVGRVVYFDGNENTYLFNNFTGLLRVKNYHIWHPKYVFYSLFANYKRGGTKAFENKTTGLHNLKIDDYVSRCEVTEIEKTEQIVICEKLDRLYGVIKLREQELLLLDALIKARFVEMFGDPDTNAKGWEEHALSEKLNVVGGYAFKSDKFDENGKIPVLRIGNINAGYFKPVNMVYWKKDKTLERYVIYPGDLVMSLTGTVGKDDYGNVCILSDDYEMYYLNQRNAKLEIKEGINKHYLSQLLKFEQIKKKLTGISRGVRQANISNNDILNLVVPIPPIELQNQFSDFVNQVNKSKVAVQKALEEAQLLFDSLMQKYFG